MKTSIHVCWHPVLLRKSHSNLKTRRTYPLKTFPARKPDEQDRPQERSKGDARTIPEGGFTTTCGSGDDLYEGDIVKYISPETEDLTGYFVVERIFASNDELVRLSGVGNVPRLDRVTGEVARLSLCARRGTAEAARLMLGEGQSSTEVKTPKKSDRRKLGEHYVLDGLGNTIVVGSFVKVGSRLYEVTSLPRRTPYLGLVFADGANKGAVPKARHTPSEVELAPAPDNKV